jgi:hypothetical protein
MQVVHPGSESRILIFYPPSRIPDPGAKRHRIPDPEDWISDIDMTPLFRFFDNFLVVLATVLMNCSWHIRIILFGGT